MYARQIIMEDLRKLKQEDKGSKFIFQNLLWRYTQMIIDTPTTPHWRPYMGSAPHTGRSQSSS